MASPPDITPQEAPLRPDVLVIESGEVLIPGNVNFGYDIGFGKLVNTIQEELTYEYQKEIRRDLEETPQIDEVTIAAPEESDPGSAHYTQQRS